MKAKSLLIAGGLVLASYGTAFAQSDEAIRIPINEWTGQHISAHITGSMLQKAGYSIEYVTAGAVPQFAAIAQGERPNSYWSRSGESSLRLSTEMAAGSRA